MELRNIVIVNDTASITGGAAKVALSSALALLKRGFSVILFSAVPPVMPEFKEKYTRVVLTGQHEILTDPSRTRALMQGIWNIRAAAAMEDLLDTLDPADSIVHIHSWTKALSSSVVRKALRKGSMQSALYMIISSPVPMAASFTIGAIKYAKRSRCHSVAS